MKYNELLKLLTENGWVEIRQKGSHKILSHPTGTENITVPYHSGKEVKKGMFQAILKKAGIKTTKR
jgi:predicted RNA binding protein YcfA (HicA-like mRNA interferase family)